MRIEQLVFQGVFGVTSPVRLALDEPISRLQIPTGVSADEIRAALYNLLYPERRTADHRDAIAGNREAKLAVSLCVDDSRFRVVRRQAQDSVRLQFAKDGGFRTVAKGAGEVGETLDERLGRPDVERFHVLNLWQFEALAPAARTASVALEELDAEAREVAEEYRESRRIERLDVRLNELEGEVEALREEWGEAIEQLRELDAAKVQIEEVELSSISEADLEMVRNREQRLQTFRDEIERLEADRDRERVEAGRVNSVAPWKSVTFWVGLLVGCGAIAAAVVLERSMAWVVMVDAVGFGMVVWVLLKYLTDRERAKIHEVRVGSIRRRIAEEREKMVDFREEIDHLLLEAGADDPRDLLERSREASHLRSVIDELEASVREFRGDEDFTEARRRLEELERERGRLEQERDELPPYGTDPARLEMELGAMGIEPEALVADEQDDGAEGGEEDGPEGFAMLAEVARGVDLWAGDGLRAGPLKVWRKICRHLLGEEFGEVRLEADAEIRFADRDATEVETWRRTHPDQVRAAKCGLALALHLARHGAERRVDNVWVESPADVFPEEVARRFEAVFKSSTSRSRFALMDGA